MNNIGRQYGTFQQVPSQSLKKETTPDKKISRQIGGMKAQGVTSISIDVDGNLVSFPKMTYVELLEAQVRELRNMLQNQEKILIKTNNRIQRLENKISHDQNMRRS